MSWFMAVDRRTSLKDSRRGPQGAERSRGQAIKDARLLENSPIALTRETCFLLATPASFRPRRFHERKNRNRPRLAAHATRLRRDQGEATGHLGKRRLRRHRHHPADRR